jgi:hypothetical protein
MIQSKARQAYANSYLLFQHLIYIQYFLHFRIAVQELFRDSWESALRERLQHFLSLVGISSSSPKSGSASVPMHPFSPVPSISLTKFSSPPTPDRPSSKALLQPGMAMNGDSGDSGDSAYFNAEVGTGGGVQDQQHLSLHPNHKSGKEPVLILFSREDEDLERWRRR